MAGSKKKSMPKSIPKIALSFAVLVFICIVIIVLINPQSKSVKEDETTLWQSDKNRNDVAENVDISDLLKVDGRMQFNWRKASYNPETGKLTMDFPNPSWSIQSGRFDEKNGVLTIYAGSSNPHGTNPTVIQTSNYFVAKQYIGKVKKIVLGNNNMFGDVLKIFG